MVWALPAPFQVSREQHLWLSPHCSGRQKRHGGGRTKNLPPVPLSRRWLKDGHPLGERDGVVVSEDGGTLLIAHVGLGHKGLYVCQGSNWAGVAQAEVQVSVQGEHSI